VGYSALSQRDEKLAQELLEEHRRLLREIFPRFHGTEIKTIGDAFLVEFGSALEAAQCAIEIQRTLAHRDADAPADRQIQVRIGVHIGDVVHRGGDVYGDGVNIASRIEPVAGPGGICVSMDVERQIRNALEARFEKLAPTDLKNISVPMDLFRIVLPWERDRRLKPERQKAFHKSAISKWMATLILVGIAFGCFLLWQRGKTKTSALTSPGPGNSIAVLPFENANHDTETEYLSDGISEALINSLSELPQLRVIARSTAFRYKGKQVEPQAVGRELKVQTVLMGIVRQLGDKLNVQVDLVDAVTGAQLWGQEYERKVVDVLAVKQALVREVTDKLRLKLTGEQEQRLTQRDTTNPEAYQFYLKGRYYWNKRTAENVKKAMDEFREAADKDPNYALAYVGLADCYVLQEDYVGIPASESYPKAKAFAQRALQLDSSLAEAHTSLGYVHTNLWEWEQAEEEFKHSIKLNPNYSTAPHWYSICLLSLGRISEAMTQIKRASELDPLSPVIGTTFTYAYFAAGDVEGAIAQCKKVVDLDPSYPRAHEYLGLGYLKQGRNSDAIAELQKAVELSGRERRPLRDLGYGYAISGKGAEALAILKELEEKFEKHEAIAQDFAAVYVGLGEKDQAFASLEKDFEAHSGLLAWIRWAPPFDSLRNDPRCTDLLRRMGLPP
jgi:TolB-like protein/Tfp pilus assembly protein PilF